MARGIDLVEQRPEWLHDPDDFLGPKAPRTQQLRSPDTPRNGRFSFVLVSRILNNARRVLLVPLLPQYAAQARSPLTWGR
jgi:hypothetical protein